MSLNMACPGCGAKLALDDALAGRTVRCPRCQVSFQAPGGQGVPEVPSPAPPPSRPTPPGGVPAQLPATMMANRMVAGRICAGCSTPIQLGQPVQNCISCMTSYHQGCWRGACANAACPTRATMLTPSGPGPQQPFHDPSRATRPCQFCGEVVDAAAIKCRFCNEWLDEKMRGGGPQAAAAKKLATESLIAGLVGLVCCGIILGPFAISKGNKSNGMLTELGQPTDGRATAGVVLGWIDVAFFIIFVLAKMGGGLRF